VSLFIGFLAVTAFDAHALFIVNQPWVKPGTRNAEGYMIFTSTEGATPIGVRPSIAVRVSLRGPGGHGRARASVALPAGTAAALRPGAERIVLTGLAHALKPGDRVPRTLQIETAAGGREEFAFEPKCEPRALRCRAARPSPSGSLDLPSCQRFPRIYSAAHAPPPR